MVNGTIMSTIEIYFEILWFVQTQVSGLLVSSQQSNLQRSSTGASFGGPQDKARVDDAATSAGPTVMISRDFCSTKKHETNDGNLFHLFGDSLQDFRGPGWSSAKKSGWRNIKFHKYRKSIVVSGIKHINYQTLQMFILFRYDFIFLLMYTLTCCQRRFESKMCSYMIPVVFFFECTLSIDTIWLVVWLPFFIFPYIGLLIIPIDFHIFQRGGPTTNQPCMCFFLTIFLTTHHFTSLDHFTLHFIIFDLIWDGDGLCYDPIVAIFATITMGIICNMHHYMLYIYIHMSFRMYLIMWPQIKALVICT